MTNIFQFYSSAQSYIFYLFLTILTSILNFIWIFALRRLLTSNKKRKQRVEKVRKIGSVYFVVKTALGTDTERKCRKALKTVANYPSVQKSEIPRVQKLLE